MYGFGQKQFVFFLTKLKNMNTIIIRIRIMNVNQIFLFVYGKMLMAQVMAFKIKNERLYTVFQIIM